MMFIAMVGDRPIAATLGRKMPFRDGKCATSDMVNRQALYGVAYIFPLENGDYLLDRAELRAMNQGRHSWSFEHQLTTERISLVWRDSYRF